MLLHQTLGNVRHLAPSYAGRSRRCVRRVASLDTVPSMDSRDSLAQHMHAVELLLPGMSCNQLASSFTSIQLTYRAALLSSQLDCFSTTSSSIASDIVEYYINDLPDHSFLLTLRAAVSQHLATAAEAAAGSSSGTAVAAEAEPESAAAAPQQQQRMHCSCSPANLSQIMAALAGLPIMVVQPLPIGFGTPRWSRPLAAADPGAWEAWLADVAAVYAALLQQQLAAPHQQQAVQQQQQQQDSGSANTAPGSAAACAVASAAAGSAAFKQSSPLVEQLAEFVISLACAMRWANVNVDDDRLHTRDFKLKVSASLQQQLGLLQPAGQQQQQQQQGQQLEHHQDKQCEQFEQQQLLLAGSLAHRLTYTMLLLLLPPPRPLLAAFFTATAPMLRELFSVGQLQALVRGLLFLGAVPPEPWLRALVDVVRGRAQELAPREVQGFVEGFRFFGTKASRAGWLRDATAQLEEFTLC